MGTYRIVLVVGSPQAGLEGWKTEMEDRSRFDRNTSKWALVEGCNPHALQSAEERGLTCLPDTDWALLRSPTGEIADVQQNLHRPT